MNDIDISGKLDKVTTKTDNDQAYIKKANGDQDMQNISAFANVNTLALRGTDGRLKVGNAVANDEAITLLQLNKSFETADKAYEHVDNKVTVIGDSSDIQYPSTGAVIKYVGDQVKVKDVTLDGTSIVNEQGIVALESTYHITLTSTSGNLEPEQYNALKADDNSYILYNPGPAFKLTKTYTSSSGEMKYQKVLGNTAYIITIQPSGAYTFSSIVLQDTTQKVTTINNSSTDTQYPSAKAVYRYVTTELGKIDQFEYKVSTDETSTPEGIVWYNGTTKITGTLKASAGTEYTIYLVPCKHTASETQKGYDEYLTIKNSAGQYV